MGGLRKRMPITFWTYLIGTLALSGIFPLAGFWSKDEILGRAADVGNIRGTVALVMLVIGAGFTAFYMWRQISLVFLGEPRTEAAAHAPESNRFMTLPLIILAVLSIFGGLLNLPEAFKFLGLPVEWLGRWLEHTITYVSTGAFNAPLAIFALAVALAAIGLAYLIYGKAPLTENGKDPLEASALSQPAFALANAKLYWDQVYGALIEQPYNRASEWFANVLDWQFWHDYVHNTLIGGSFNGIAAFLNGPVDRGFIDAGFLDLGKIVQWFGGRMRRFQTE